MKAIGRIIGFLIGILGLLFLDFKLGKKRNKSLNSKCTMSPGQVSLFTSGKHLFEDFFKEIKQANKQIHILFYIVKNDEFSKRFFHLLEEKARSGVEVRLLVDFLGGLSIPHSRRKSLKESGVLFAYSYKPRPPFFFYSLQKRNHRKIAIIDGKIGYLGGFNIGKEYIDQDKKLNPWRDYHLKMTGSSVIPLQNVFLHDWNLERKPEQQENHSSLPSTGGRYPIQLLVTDGNGLEDSLIQLLHCAKNRIIIGTPYFIPGPSFFQKLRETIRRGVHVTIIIPKIADHAFVKEAGHRFLRPLLEEGAQILEYQKGFYHSKVMLIDDTICDIGTANLDKRSFYLNGEINCLITDADFIKTLQRELDRDISECRPIEMPSLYTRDPVRFIKERVADLLSPFL
ncbi:cardiolipin synthase [Bacillus massiliglaciei]|uniref:cardiolipin synthase n=1 Tax=Bacillus massiliglaciei TaxID=1816693 RepID=UPI000A890A25|nr:cardiolipin synthase [Bacillus massiliglaciei]